MTVLIVILLKVLEIYSYILFAYAMLSWIPSLYDSVLGRLIQHLALPVIRPFQRFKLQFGGLDWTILVICILMNLFSRFLVELFNLLNR